MNLYWMITIIFGLTLLVLAFESWLETSVERERFRKLERVRQAAGDLTQIAKVEYLKSYRDMTKEEFRAELERTRKALDRKARGEDHD